MKKYLLMLLLLMLPLVVQSEANAPPEAPDKKDVLNKKESSGKKEKSWWQIRQQKVDIFYPHKPHMNVMQDGGDACMLCHPFSKNTERDEKILAQLTQINNEALEAICHDCHVEKMNAPSECRLCHTQPSSIWPSNHDYDYKNHHAIDAQQDQATCNTCHKKIAFCTDCHFKRNFSSSDVHPLAYKTLHGLDARMAPAQCGACHQTDYCTDCHRRRP